MPFELGTWQWRMLVTVYHGPSYGHYMEMETLTRGRGTTLHTGLGNWKGLGIPEPVLNEARALIDAQFSEHLVTRYGVAGELPLKWGGEPEPF